MAFRRAATSYASGKSCQGCCQLTIARVAGCRHIRKLLASSSSYACGPSSVSHLSQLCFQGVTGLHYSGN